MSLFLFNHVITFKNENNCFKLVINLISNLHLLISWISFDCVVVAKPLSTSKIVPMTLSFSPFKFGTVFQFLFCSQKVLKHCLKILKMKDCCLKLEMVENLKDWNVLIQKLEMVWKWLKWKRFVLQNNITFQFDNVICYSNLMKLVLFILHNFVDNIKYFVPSY